MTPANNRPNPWRSARVLIIGLTATVVVLVLALVAIAISRSAAPASTQAEERVNVLAASTNECVTCHRQSTPGIAESDAIVAPLKEQGIMTDRPFDMPIDFTYFELWHHWGRTTKFGVWMQGPDYTQWHGAYEVLSDLVELREMTTALQEGDSITHTTTPTTTPTEGSE